MIKTAKKTFRIGGALLLFLAFQIAISDNASAQLGGWKKADRNANGQVEVSSQVLLFGPTGRASTSFGPRVTFPGRTIRFGDNVGIYTVIEDVTLNGAGNVATFQTNVSYWWFGRRYTLSRLRVIFVTD